MNLKSIIQSTTRYNFHSHTQFCDGRATMVEMAKAAVAVGMEHYGFSPHSPIPIESPCNMSASDVDAYFEEYKRIASMPELSACRFYAGMEVDYLGRDWGPAHPYFKSLPLDFIIGSVHFIPTQKGELVDIDGHFERFNERMNDKFDNDIEYVVDTFFSQSEDMVRAGGFDIIGHFDKVGHNASHFAPGIENSSFYRERIDSLINLIIDRKCTVEINTKAHAEHERFFPSERYFDILVDAGITLPINSDAHQPDKIESSRDTAFAALNNIVKHRG